MNLVFLGSSAFSVPFLDSLYCSVHNIPLVITNPDAPAGRGKKLRPNPVKIKAMDLNIRVVEATIIDDSIMRALAMEDLDGAVVVSFGKILPEEFLVYFHGQCINIHPSLLPEYRGPTPITSVLENGEKLTGISIMKMSPEMDAGPVYVQAKFGIGEDDNKDSLEEKMIRIGSSLLETTLNLIEDRSLEPFLQNEEGATYTKLTDKKDLRLNWSEAAEKIANRIRAYSSMPGCYSFYKGKRVKLLKAKAVPWKKDSNIAPGTVAGVDKQKGFFIKCGSSALLVEILQPAGKKPLSSVAFLNGYKLKPGEKFE
ncbi:MAG: methionyl-tRNA formyltransferase [Actinomycetota bacterium]